MTGNFHFPRNAFLGFDHLFDELERVTNHAKDSYPPHNVVKYDDLKYDIELAIAGGIHLGHGVMDLRYHEGGRECGQPCTVTGTVNAKMQMFALDVVVPAGNALELVITQTNDDYIPSPVSSGYVTVGTNQNSVLSLPIIDRGADDLFTPPVWYENNE